MSILRDLADLVEANVISEETAEDIRKHYRGKNSDTSTNRLFTVFAILGAILVGLGIILIIAHNWDDLSKSIKTFFAFLPLLLGQLSCGYTLLKKKNSKTWRESSSAFLFFAVGASISLVSQVYHIPGDLSSFLLTWMLICLPIVYVMQSSFTSLLFIAGITYYACQASYWSFPHSDSYMYWAMLLGIIPFYYFLLRENPKSNYSFFHNWFIPLSITIVLGTLADKNGELMYISYFSLLGIFYMLGDFNFFSKTKFSGYPIIGSLGSLILLTLLSFDWFWEDLGRRNVGWENLFPSQEFIAALLLTLLACVVLYFNLKQRNFKEVKPMAPLFLLFVVAFIIGIYSYLAVILINIYVLTLGLLTIREGAKQDHLGILNYGLIIITVLVVCRFFDTDLSFVIRGILFLSVGAGFFLANYMMLKKRKNES